MRGFVEQLLYHRATQLGLALALLAVVVGAVCVCYSNRKPRMAFGCSGAAARQVVEVQAGEEATSEPQCGEASFCATYSTISAWSSHWSAHQLHGFDTNGMEVLRPYAPTTLDSDIGFFELVIKIYKEGKVSAYFGKMKEGEYPSARGPKGCFRYKPNQVWAVGMLAGGTGITPMYQVARAILENPEDKTKIYMIYANVTYDDILLKEDLDRFARGYPGQFKVYYVLNQPPTEWGSGVGYVSKGMIEANCSPPTDDL